MPWWGVVLIVFGVLLLLWVGGLLAAGKDES